MEMYYRIPSENRDLKYAMYITKGQEDISTLDDYTSHNTTRLNLELVKKQLLKLNFIKRHIRKQKNS